MFMLTKILSLISAVIGIPVFIDGISLIATGSNNIGTYFTVFAGIFFIMVAVFLKIVKNIILRPVFKLFSAVTLLVAVLFSVSSGFLFIYGKADTATYTEDYLMVLGCGLNGSEPSEVLANRLDKAVQYAERNKNCTIIVTGGMGRGEDIPESAAMYEYLVTNGIDPERILKESESTSTAENFKYSNILTKNDLQSKSAVFITNDFHIYRASSLAKLQGMHMTHLSAKTPIHSVIPSYIRENLALVQMFVFGK